MDVEKLNMKVIPGSPTTSGYENIPDTESDVFDYTHEKLDYSGVLTPSPYIPTNEGTKKLVDFIKVVYDGTQMVMYYILVGILGVVLAFVWGLVFGLLNFATVFVVQPAFRIIASTFRCTSIVFVSLNRMIWDPFYKSVGLCLSRIGGKVHVSYRNVETV